MPPSNQQRRNDLTDAAIDIIVRNGLHGLSHREVDEAARVPRGTASNYFRSRDALLEAAVRRVVELHFALIEQRRAQLPATPSRRELIEFLIGVVEQALTRHRGRYIAMFELVLEGTRRPELQDAFASLADEAIKLTQEAHRGGGELRDDVASLNVIYNGVLFTSLVMPQTLGGRAPAEITRDLLEVVL